MLTMSLNLMLYVDDVAAEKAFWQAVGFEIVSSQELMGYETFDMRLTPDSSAIQPLR